MLLAARDGDGQGLAEVDTVFDGRIAEYHDIPKPKLTCQIITESPPVYPPAQMATRLTTTDTELAGHHPTDTIIIFSLNLLHHRADFYLYPNRWQDDNTRPLLQGVLSPPWRVMPANASSMSSPGPRPPLT